MSKTHKDQRNHRRKVAGKAQGFREHQKRDYRRKRHRLTPPDTSYETGLLPLCVSKKRRDTA